MAPGKLKIDIRRQKILEQLNHDGQVSVAKLSKDLDTTPVTIRNDLDALAREGRLERIQGGAVCVHHGYSPYFAADNGASVYQMEKQAIAQRALEYIQDGDTLFINSGSTTLAVAQALSKRKWLNVVTNSLAVANCLAHQVTIRVVLLGGELNADYGFTYGGDAVEQLRRYQPAWSILSVDGVDAQHGITTYHAEEAMLDRMMMDQAHKTIVVADHRKIGKAGFTRICGISTQHILITDSGCDDAMLEPMRSAGATVCVAD